MQNSIDDKINVIPQPKFIETYEGRFEFGTETVFGENAKEYEYLFSDLPFSGKGGGRIKFIIDDKFIGDNLQDDCGYEITIDDDVTVTGCCGGMFYAAVTLKQLAILYFDGETSKIPFCKIKDKPDFSYRGFMLDVSRHFFKIEFLYKVADVLSLFKFNAFHLHLSDDQGFRFGSEKFPFLTEKGSVRSGTKGDGKKVEGFYTKTQLKSFVEYCKARRITVIPEIDIPAHTGAILASYPEFGCAVKDRKVREYFGISSDILCAGKSAVYDFLYGLIDEIVEVFDSPLIHIGGDEAVKDEWKKCPDCNRMMKAYGIGTYKELQSFFLNCVCRHIEKKGKTAVVWNEAVSGGRLKSVVCQYWTGGKDGKAALSYADGGGKLIVSKCNPYYLDYPGGMHSLKSIYHFNPLLDGLTIGGVKNVLGIESPLWTEYVPSEENAFKKMFPRLFAVAERGWNGNVDKNGWADFVARAEKCEKVLEFYGIKGTPVKDAAGKGNISETIKFGVGAFDKTSIKSLVNMIKAKSEK